MYVCLDGCVYGMEGRTDGEMEDEWMCQYIYL